MAYAITYLDKQYRKKNITLNDNKQLNEFYQKHEFDTVIKVEKVN